MRALPSRVVFNAFAATAVLLCVARARASAQPERAFVRTVGARQCTYDDCSLRLEGRRIMRGTRGTEARRLGVFRATRVENLFAGSSDSAIAYAHVFDGQYRTALRATWVGTISAPILLGAAFGRAQRASNLSSGDYALFATGIAALMTDAWGLWRIGRSRVTLERAIWWHNRSLSQ